METDLKFAVLIDAENISDKYIKIILDETANSGVATYKRIYGDWTSPQLASWKSILLDNSIIPMQQYCYTSGKNSTDSAMIIDAMDILYSGTVDGFCIVSSDSDFTRLVARLRESGMQVIGMGERKTPKPFISACNQFKYLDILFANSEKAEKKKKEAQRKGAERKEAERRAAEKKERELEKKEQEKARKLQEAAEQPGTKKSRRAAAKARNAKKENIHAAAVVSVTEQEMETEEIRLQTELAVIRQTIASLVEKFSDEDGWVFSGKLGSQLQKRVPDFDVRNFGYSKLTPFIESLGEYEINRISRGNNQRLIYFRAKAEE